MKVKELIKLIETDAWVQARMRGSQHPTKSGTVTISGKPNVDVPPGTLNSVLKQADIKE
jgi:predicted RNA binding protein YcfA (HicA-like mRNA interferase family)